VAIGGSPAFELPLFPIAPGTWATFEDFDNAGGNGFDGLELRVRNRDGGTSPVFVIL